MTRFSTLFAPAMESLSSFFGQTVTVYVPGDTTGEEVTAIISIDDSTSSWSEDGTETITGQMILEDAAVNLAEWWVGAKVDIDGETFGIQGRGNRSGGTTTYRIYRNIRKSAGTVRKDRK